jgi:hypothetical protein
MQCQMCFGVVDLDPCIHSLLLLCDEASIAGVDKF